MLSGTSVQRSWVVVAAPGSKERRRRCRWLPRMIQSLLVDTTSTSTSHEDAPDGGAATSSAGHASVASRVTGVPTRSGLCENVCDAMTTGARDAGGLKGIRACHGWLLMWLLLLRGRRRAATFCRIGHIDRQRAGGTLEHTDSTLPPALRRRRRRHHPPWDRTTQRARMRCHHSAAPGPLVRDGQCTRARRSFRSAHAAGRPCRTRATPHLASVWRPPTMAEVSGQQSRGGAHGAGWYCAHAHEAAPPEGSSMA